MSNIKVIKTGEDYREALELIDALMANDPDPESEDGEKLTLLSALVEDYESKVLPESLPGPVEAIKFRMEQEDLKPADLIPYLGSRSRVSEVLSGKRKLTLDMMRALESGLGIPAKVLLKQESENELQYSSWSARLLKEMEKRGYFGNTTLKEADTHSLIESFFASVGAPNQVFGMLRTSEHVRSSNPVDRHALTAWATRVLQKAKEVNAPKYKEGTVDVDFMRELLTLSTKEKSPIRAQEFLKKNGIILIVEPHLSKTYLDGAAILINKDNPVIGLTIRYDRLDNFWFTLLHELAHVALHSDSNINLFFDDLDKKEVNDKENEADHLAEEALIPTEKWEKSPAKRVPSPLAAKSLADELGVHVALVAGSIMYRHSRFYSDLNKITNTNKVREYFPDINWAN